MAHRHYSTPRYKKPRKKISKSTRRGLQLGAIYGMSISTVKGHNLKTRVYVTGVTTAAGAGIGAGINKRKEYKMAKGKKGSWRGGNAPAQGGTPQKISRPNSGTGKFKGSFKKGKRTAKRSGTS